MLRIQGCNSDIPLNETGKQQVDSLASRLKSEPIKAIYSSPLRRSLETARTIARPHRLKVQLEPDLRELDLGELEGVKVGEIKKSYREILFINGDRYAIAINYHSTIGRQQANINPVFLGQQAKLI